jgi:hypothetical protein
VIIDCEGAMEKFTLESMREMSEVDIDIARLRLIPFYRHNCKFQRMKWEEIAEQFDTHKFDNYLLGKLHDLSDNL